MFLIKRLLVALSSGKERDPVETEERFLHVGYLGPMGPNKEYSKANLSLLQEKELETLFRDHKKDPGIYCEMDAIAKLFPDLLRPISNEEAVGYIADADPDADMYY